MPYSCQHDAASLLAAVFADTHRVSTIGSSEATKLNNPHLLAVSHSFPILQLSQPTCAGTQRSFHDS